MEYRNIITHLENEGIIKGKASIVIHPNTNNDEIDFTFINELNTEINYGRIMYNDIKVNYCIISENTLIKKLQEAYYSNDFEYLRRFAFSNFVGRKAYAIGRLAKEIFSSKINKSFSNKDLLDIINLKDEMNELRLNMNKASFYAIYYVLLENIRTKYLYINGLINFSIENFELLLKDKSYALKYVHDSKHSLPDPLFSNWYTKCLKIQDRSDMLSNLDNLFYHSFGSLISSFTNYEVSLKK